MAAQTIKERVEILEQEVRELKSLLHKNGKKKLRKDWTKVVGLFSNDPGFEELVRLGAKIRKES
jgi:hypothetical protein